MLLKKLLLLVTLIIAGCATVPVRQALPTYHLNGSTYYSLVSLCDSRNISWQYDTFSRIAVLSKDAHKINLMVGENIALVDGVETHLIHPVDIYQGTVVVPYRFKDQVIDVLFKEDIPGRKARAPLVKIKKIVIDAGHGGNDPGTIGRTTGVREKDINLDIAKRLSNLLRSQGVEVVMTRSTDTFVPLSRRVEIANNSGADLFISIHSNANRVRSLNGFEVYYVAPSVSDSRRAFTAARQERLNLRDASFASHSADLKAILWDMIYTNARAESIELSRSLCRAMDNNLDVRIIGIRAGRFEVLRGVHLPAVLIEAGFLSNPTEERRLRNSYYRQKIAEAVIEGVADYAQDAPVMEVAKR